MEAPCTVKLTLPTSADAAHLAVVLRDAANRTDDGEQAKLWLRLAETCDNRAVRYEPQGKMPAGYKKRANRGEEDIRWDWIDVVVDDLGPSYPQLSLVETLIAVERMMDRGISSRRMAPRLNTTQRNVDRYRRMLRDREESEKSPA